MNLAQVTMKHFLMLKYWHKRANSDLKEHYRLPEVGETFDGLARRKLNDLDIQMIEHCYEELRGLIKNEYEGKMELYH